MRHTKFALFVVAAAAMSVASAGQRGSAGYIPQVNAGDRALAAHRYASAASAYRYALEWNKDGVDAHTGLGQVFLKTGKKDRAFEEFTIALRIQPHCDAAERGIHEARTPGQEEAAFVALATQVASEPNNAEIQTTYAEELIERDRLDDAKAHAQVALKIDAHSWHAYCALGRIAAKDGDHPTAIKNLTIAIAHDDRDDDAISTMGDIAMSEKRYTDAVRFFRMLVRVLPEETEGYHSLIAALDAAQDKSGADHAREDLKKLELYLSGSKN